MASLEELIAFNDEVASLARAGVPIDLGLSQLGRSATAACDSINAKVAMRVQKGVSLADAMEESNEFPPIYQNVVRAGLRCGRLPAALEGLNRYSQSLIQMRQNLGSALIYPLIICAIAYVLLVGACLTTIPIYRGVLADMGMESNGILNLLSSTLPFWIAIPPLIGMVLLYRWLRPGNGASLSNRGWGWLPGVAKIVKDGRYANMTQLLALLVENEVPLHEGLQLASAASGDPTLASVAQSFANANRLGQSFDQAPEFTKFPPFLRWALTSSNDSQGLARTLRLASETYNHRARRRADWLRATFPLFALVLLGGSVTLLYCLTVFMPILRLIQSLS